MKLIIYRIYQVCIMMPMMLVATVLTALVTIIFSAVGFGKVMGYFPEVIWSRIMCWLALVRVTVRGRENIDPATSYVFVANHQGAYDIFTIYGYLGHNFRWMMKQSLRKIPLVGFACYKSGHIFVDNSSPKAVKQTLGEAERRLSGGMSLVVFPEGARSWTGKMRKFKKGAYRLAMEFNLPVVPLTIDGAFDVLPRFKKLPHWGHIYLTIHKPIEPGAEGHDLQALIDGSFAEINAALPSRHRATADKISDM